MSKSIPLAGLALAAMLAACSTPDIEAVRLVESNVSPFAKALSREYRELAVFEADQMYDFIDAGKYARRGLAAARGNPVEPFVLSDWNLPDDKMPELTEARARLVAALERDGRSRAPDAAADAQGKFDCWVEQQEENHQFDHIAACRKAFRAALSVLEGATKQNAVAVPVAPPPKPVADQTGKVLTVAVKKPDPAPMIRDYVVFFAFDSARLDAAGKRIIADAVAAWRAAPTAVHLAGHADRAGARRYNRKLSMRRAATVGEALHRGGIPRHLIKSVGYGEDRMAVVTADEVRKAENRRVEITIK